MIPLPWYIKVPLAIALNALLSFLLAKGVDPVVIAKVKEVLAFLGLLGASVHLDTSKFETVHAAHCEGVACPADLVKE